MINLLKAAQASTSLPIPLSDQEHPAFTREGQSKMHVSHEVQEINGKHQGKKDFFKKRKDKEEEENKEEEEKKNFA